MHRTLLPALLLLALVAGVGGFLWTGKHRPSAGRDGETSPPPEGEKSPATVPVSASDPADEPIPPNPLYTFGEPSADGIGKFYLGREISFVMGHPAIGWLERSEREREERPSLLIGNMGLKPDDVVADIGAGSGFFTFRMAPLVPEGKVYAVDIQQEMIDFLERREGELGIDNVETVLGVEDDTRLPENAVDAVLLVDAYHEFSHPWEMMRSIYRALKPGGRVILIEYRAEDPEVPIKRLHKMTEAQAKAEMAAAGFEWKETRGFLPWQHFMEFVRPAGS